MVYNTQIYWGSGLCPSFGILNPAKATLSRLMGYCRVALVRTEVSEKRIVCIITVIKIGELRTKLATKALYVPPKRLFLQTPRGATSQKRTFFIVTAVKTSNIEDSLLL
jgi:hypothetical protein